EIGALDFASNGDLYVSLRRGDIVVAKPQADPKAWEWRRFATGFHNPCGIHIIKPGHIVISQMAELTEVIDTDGDGVADDYTNLSMEIGLSGNYHETNALCPDGKGGYYIAPGTASHNGPTSSTPSGTYSPIGRYGRNYSSVRWRGWVMHRAADGTLTPVSSGYRMHNGIERGPDGSIWCGDNQGDWRAASPVYNASPDTFSGHPSSLVWDSRFADIANPLYMPRVLLDDLWNKPAFHLPHAMIRSCAEPVFIPEGDAFPFAGQMLVPDQSGTSIVRCMPERVDGAYQGAATLFYGSNGLRRGNNRLTFSPDGGTLYVGQTGRGWGNLSEGMQRIRYTGALPFHLQNCTLTQDGFVLSFTKPLAEIGEIKLQRYRYAYRYQYGSPEQDKTPVTTKITIDDADPRRVTVSAELIPNWIYRFDFGGAKSATGETYKEPVIYTLNRLRRPETAHKVTLAKSADKLRVAIDGKPFTEVRLSGFSNPILYPIANASGTNLMRDWPIREDGRAGEEKDHPHHKSLFVGHQGINGTDFWHEDRANCGTIEHQRLIETRSGKDRALARSYNVWKDKAGKTILSDTRELQFGVVDGVRYIDLELNLHASHGDVTFEEFKDGFIGLRTHPHLRLDAKPSKGVNEVFGKAENNEGITGGDIWGKRADWVHYHGEVEGKPAGIAILSHPENPRNPSWWHARGYGLVSVNPFGPKKSGADGAYELANGSSLTLRYRFLFHDQESAKIADQYARYAAEKLVPRTVVAPIPAAALRTSVAGKVVIPKNLPKRGGAVAKVTRKLGGKSSSRKIVAHGLYEGQKIYNDREFTFAQVPADIRGADLIITSNNDKKSPAKGVVYEVEMKVPGTILLLLDTRVGKLPWVAKAGFTRSKQVVRTDSEFSFQVYTVEVEPGVYALGDQFDASFYSVGVLKSAK
ncbi:MAG: hypothetical protein ACI8W8_004717, partial [Rhodothermales bacterium]